MHLNKRLYIKPPSKHLWPRGALRSLRAAWDRQEQKPAATNVWFIHLIPGNKCFVCFEFISGYRRCWKSGCADGKGNSSLRTRNNQRDLGREIHIPYGWISTMKACRKRIMSQKAFHTDIRMESVYQKERENGNEDRGPHFPCNCCFRGFEQLLSSSDKDPTINTSAVKS